MSSLNKVFLLGNMGKDPEKVAATSSIAKFSIATAHRHKDSAGEWVEKTEWHSIVCFGRTADNVTKYCRKGSSVLVEGRLTTRKWQDKEGKDRYTTEVVAESVTFVGKKQEGAGSKEYKPWSPKDPVTEPLNVPPPPNDAQYDFGDFDIPF